MCGLISKKNYQKMKERLKSLSDDYKTESSSNFSLFLSRFESDDDSWIDKLNKELEGE